MMNANLTMKREELTKMAMDLGLKGISKLNKEQLVEVINNKMEENTMANKTNGVSVGDLNVTMDNANQEETVMNNAQNTTAQVQVNNNEKRGNRMITKTEIIEKAQELGIETNGKLGKELMAEILKVDANAFEYVKEVSKKEDRKYVVTDKDASYLMKRLCANMRAITIEDSVYVNENGLFFVPTKATGKLEAANGIIMMTTLSHIKGVIKFHILVKEGKKSWQIKKEDKVDDAKIQAYLDTLVSKKYLSVFENDGKDGNSVPVYYFRRSQLNSFIENGIITSTNVLQVK